jgi:membrane-associated phospholipid phosphatase
MSLTHADLTIAEQANRFAAHHDGWEDAARAWAQASELVFLGGVILLIAVGLVTRRRRLAAAGGLAVLAAGASLAVGLVVARLVDRPRPFVAHPQIHAFLPHAADGGFPSDHATAAFAIAVVLLLCLGPWALPVLVAAVALAASRVVVGVHYPADVIAGALIGTLGAVVVYAAASSVWSRRVAVKYPTSTRMHARNT